MGRANGQGTLKGRCHGKEIHEERSAKTKRKKGVELGQGSTVEFMEEAKVWGH